MLSASKQCTRPRSPDLDDGEPHAREDRFHAVAHDREGMAAPEPRRPPGSVTSTAPAGRGIGVDGFLVGGPARFDLLFQLVCVAPNQLLLTRPAPVANQLHPGRHNAVLAAEEAVADRLRVARCRGG
jgi:hypothetical protein